jgi:hypothetical protein
VELPSMAPTMCEHKSGVCEEPVREIRNLTWSSSSKAEAIAAILVLSDRLRAAVPAARPPLRAWRLWSHHRPRPSGGGVVSGEE